MSVCSLLPVAIIDWPGCTLSGTGMGVSFAFLPLRVWHQLA